MDDTLASRLGRAASRQKAATDELRAVFVEAFDESDLTNKRIAEITRNSVDSVRVRRRRHRRKRPAGRAA